MAVGLQSRTKMSVKKVARRKAAKQVQVLPPEEAAAITAPHVAGKPAEREPEENAYRPHEEPEASSRGSEAPDAGYGRCTESSDFANRGRNWS